MQRRHFIRTSTAAVVAGLRVSTAAEAIQEAARKVGRLPRRKLGSGSREISVLIGAGDWAPEAVEAGILSGINFWHRANEWRTPPKAILKDREAYYCTVCVDRVRGNHESGQIDAGAHYQFVRQTVKRTGLRYFDDMQFHFGYHSVAELKNDRAFIRAFERLKKEGLVRHLCLSQHSYDGNLRVPGGQSAPEILTAVVQDGSYEHAQPVYSYGDTKAINDFLALAKRKGVGTVAMKTAAGVGRMLQDRAFMKTFPAGTTPYHALARWLTTRAQLDAAVIRINSLSQFVDTCSAAGKDLRAADERAIQQMSAYADREACRLCNQCLPHCRQQLPIADILRFHRYAADYGDLDRARRLYAQLDRQASSCTACGTCLSHCPQGLRIPDQLAAAHRLLKPGTGYAFPGLQGDT